MITVLIAQTLARSQTNNILNEMLKCASARLIDHLRSYLVPIILKKGDASDPNNYRGIDIGSCHSKTFLGIINNRLTLYLENTNLLDSQCGFRKDFITT